MVREVPAGSERRAFYHRVAWYGRRDHVFIYQGPQLSAIVKQQYKRHFAGQAPGLAGKGFFDLEKDPREEHPLMSQFQKFSALD